MASTQSGNRPLWILGSIILLVVLATAGATLWMVAGRTASAADVPAEAATTAKPPAKPVFFRLDPFTVNIHGGSYGPRLLYVEVTLALGNKSTHHFLKDHLPQVRNRLLLVLSGQNAQTLTTTEGKKALAATIRTALDKPLVKSQPALAIDKVLFTQFIVQ
ncbi:MAG TPA: flagellar basal body-associated protein FliL [Oleiagrimonas sp.]|nr:flagellar basal body-associated protein FliL [Oleiagrimonas sp.]